jgi:energy-coupling factor transporter ATP-binding protein EcfA2
MSVLRSTMKKWGVGSEWLRWDPHLHAPGTLRNDQFKQDWDGYLRSIDEANPAPVGLGITDYFCLRSYKAVRARIAEGALSRVALVFPNIELRLTIETRKGQGINLHLLVSPDDEHHVERVEEALGRLQFDFKGEHVPCTEAGLARLGRAHRGDVQLPHEAALSAGANQFKVELSQVRSLFNDGWIKENVLVAVAAGDDGLSGIAEDAGFHAQREELGRFAHIVFSGRPGDRKYWLGLHQDFERNGQTPKPCLHGSDAHSVDAVLAPTGNRRCWIRGAPTFDGLRQALVEPERRVHIGEVRPSGSAPSDTIRWMRVKGAPWLKNNALEFNDGLVTVIGAKGSGKTALADLLAFAADAFEEDPGPASFIAKARGFLDGVEVEIEWMDGARQSRRLGEETSPFGLEPEPRVRYLSQQFVERLCSPGSLGEPLVEEIERVVFAAIPEEDRLACTSFNELRGLRVEGHLADQEAHRELIRRRTNGIANEHALHRVLPTLKTKLQGWERDRKALARELASIPLKVEPEKLKALQVAAEALQQAKAAVGSAERKAQELADLVADLRRRERMANEELGGLKERFPTLSNQSWWDAVRLTFSPEILPKLELLEKETRGAAGNLRRFGVEPPPSDGSETRGLPALGQAVETATKELGADQTKVARRTELEKRVQAAQQAEDRARTDVSHAEKSPTRLKEAWNARLVSYEAVFEALKAEERALWELYSPLQKRIAQESSLSKLSFSVNRVVDIDTWAVRGEGLLDLRRPPFQRRGQLAEVARTALLSAWRTGAPDDVREAMKAFLDQHAGAAVDALAQGVTPLNLGEWLFSTDHVRVQYGIQYEGVDIANLSPGTRGVVLLALYLRLDESDRRPLVIDQPEENLDPRSVFTELVPYFRAAAQRRQVIMVTHNANLVVNTDSDQVVVAEASRQAATGLPDVTYSSGGLEDSELRAQVCSLLEGGEEAFKKRGQRYGVSLGAKA